MAEKTKHTAGWYAGALVFWLLSAWLITVGLSSIIPQIFSPAGQVERGASSCATELRGLRDELLAHVGETFTNPEPEEARLSWFDAWDQRLFRARPACTDAGRDAWTELNRLRHGLSALSERFEREELPHLQRLDRLLGSPETAEARAALGRTTHE